MRNEEIVEMLLKKHALCTTCLGRQFPSVLRGLDNALKGKKLKEKLGINDDSNEVCYICGNILSAIKKYGDMVIQSLQLYDFESLVIGAHIPTTLVEREDHLRSEMKLKGGETFKANFTRELNNIVSRKLKVDIIHRQPDVTVIVDLHLDVVNINSKSIFLYGRYIKTKRGITQKNRKCRECRGQGCPECNLTGYANVDSVENRVTEPLLSLFNANQIKFTWIGSEDYRSLVLGQGRPFYAEVIEPRIRCPKSIKQVMKKVDDGVFIKDVRILNQRPREQRHFTITLQSKLQLDKRVTRKTAKMLEEKLEGASVNIMSPNKKKSNTKNIYSFKVESVKDCHLQVKVICEGGLKIRSLFSGEGCEVIPSVASILERKVTLDEEMPFDILDVDFAF